MSVKMSLQGIAAALMIAGGFASTASAQTVCNTTHCECKFNWGLLQRECRNTQGWFRADKIDGVDDNIQPSAKYLKISLRCGISSSNIPITSSGALFPEACRVTDQIRDNVAAFRTCQDNRTPAKMRVLVGGDPDCVRNQSGCPTCPAGQ
jgi:hypothetical protein